MMDNQLSFSGGKDKVNYYISVGLFNQTGILIGSDFKRYSTRFNIDDQVKDWLKVGISANINKSTQNVTLADAAESTIWWAALQSPLVPVKNIDGTWAGNTSVGGYTYTQDNPVATSSNRGNTSDRSSIFGNLYADLTLFKGMTFRNEFSYNIGISRNIAFQYAANVGTRSLQAQLYDQRSDSYYLGPP